MFFKDLEKTKEMRLKFKISGELYVHTTTILFVHFCSSKNSTLPFTTQSFSEFVVVTARQGRLR